MVLQNTWVFWVAIFGILASFPTLEAAPAPADTDGHNNTLTEPPSPPNQPPPVEIKWIHVKWANESDPFPLVILDNETKALLHYDEELEPRLFGIFNKLVKLPGEIVGGAINTVGSAVGLAPGRGDYAGIIDKAVSGGKGIASLVRAGIDILKLFGIEKKENAILVDNRCGSCQLFVRCGTGMYNTDNFEVSAEDGLIVRFSTYLPRHLPFNAGLINYACEISDNNLPRRWGKIDAYGNSAPREKYNIFEIGSHSIIRINSEGRVDGRTRAWSW